MRLLFLFVFFGALAAAGWYYIFSNKVTEVQETAKKQQESSIPAPSTTPEEIDYKASFAVFTEGTFRVFTDAMYHNLNDAVFMEAQSPNVVRVKQANKTWDDFFKTLPMKLTKECLTTGTGQEFCSNRKETLKFYINETSDPDALDRLIGAGDRLLVSYGAETDEQINEQLKQVPAVK